MKIVLFFIQKYICICVNNKFEKLWQPNFVLFLKQATVVAISYCDSKVLFLYTYVSDVKKYILETISRSHDIQLEKVHGEIFQNYSRFNEILFWIFPFGFSLWDFTYKKSCDFRSYVERIAINFCREDLSSCQKNSIA